MTAVTDQTKAEAFMGKVINDFSAGLIGAMCALGDRLDLFKNLDAAGPATSDELAERTGLNERYLREWLSALYCAGYLEYDATSRRFTLPPEHAQVLAAEGTPMFLGGGFQYLPPMFGVIDRIEQAFRNGGGVPMSAYDRRMFDTMERLSAPVYDNMLVTQWIPTMPSVQALLEQGCDVADVGCGRGRALINLAKAFPDCRYTGYDCFPLNVREATANVVAAGVADRVCIKERDVAQGLTAQYDLITSFDVVHDAVDPGGMLLAIRQALRPGGRYVAVEPGISDKLEQNVGPLGAVFYSDSVLYCMTVSLAEGGAGLGTAGLPESKLRELCTTAGFGDLRRMPIEDPFHNVYEVML
ncbi:MAG TPA: methyltransferase [Herpetosiphonaceae bacterium]|nr:methyltransferase [Herpetosiphonaceae bacterium]